MRLKRRPKTVEFVAIDELGKCVLIVEHIEIVGEETENVGLIEAIGRKHYLTASNEKVEMTGDGSYAIVSKNMLLKRVS